MSGETGNKIKTETGSQQAGKYFIQDVFNLILIFLLVVFFFLDILLNGQIFFAGDVMNVYSPWQWYNHEALMAGRFPLWSDDFFMGFPLFAESQGALFYPPTRLVYLFIPTVKAFSYDVVLHFLLAGWFQYFLARTLKLPPWASLFASLAFAFSGLFLSLPINFTIFRSIVWIPLIFMFMTMGAKRASLVFPLLASIALVFQMMGGSLQVTGITVLALVPYVIFLVLSPGKGKQTSFVPVLQFILMLMLGVFLYAFQLLPTLELMLHAWRGTQGGYEVASAFSFPPEHFIDVVTPTFYGVYADGSLLPVRITANFFPYIGIAPLLLILPALGSKKRGVFILFFLLVIFLILAIGKYGPLYEFIYTYVPFFDKFRAPDRFWIIAIFAGTLLSGFGLDAIVTGIQSEKPVIQPALMGLVGSLLFLVALFSLGVLFVPAIREIWYSIFAWTLGEFIGGGKGGVSTDTFNRWQVHLAFALFHALIAAAIFHYAIGLFGKKGRAGGLITLLVLLTIADLYFMSLNVPGMRTTNKNFFTEPPRSAEVLMRDGERTRFYSTLRLNYARDVFGYQGSDDQVWYNGGGSNNIDDYLAFREALSPNISMHWGLKSSNGFASLFLESYFNLEAAASRQLLGFVPNQQIESEHLKYWDDRSMLIDLMASRYVLTPVEFTESDRFTLIDDGPIKIYRNNYVFPRAWVARPERILPETDDWEDELFKGELDPRIDLIMHPLPIERRTFPEGSSGTATATIMPVGGLSGSRVRGGGIIDEQVFVDVYTPDPAYLVLADTWYPGWRAEIDGVPVKTIYRVFNYYRGIEIPEGSHRVRFYYRPPSFSIGTTISVGTVCVMFLLLFVQLIFFTKPKSSRFREFQS
ncbi:YfhO family protein [bacterium]|nr:YfhO family protein [bacterium]